jgi:hypothetical protein
MRAAFLAVLLSIATAQAAQALTIRDIIELTKAGVAEDVLLALIDVDGGVYATDTATLKRLKEAGVSEKVMVALIRSGRQRPVEPPIQAPVVEEAAAPAPQVVVIEHHEPQVQQVAVPVPVYVPVYPTHVRSRRAVDYPTVVETPFVSFQPLPPVTARPRQEPAAAPVYWGFGGKLRPDAWGQTPDRDKKKPDETDTARPPRKQ